MNSIIKRYHLVLWLFTFIRIYIKLGIYFGFKFISQHKHNSMDRSNEIDQLKELLTTIEESEKTEEVIQWLRDICSPNDQLKLIESLIESFMQNL